MENRPMKRPIAPINGVGDEDTVPSHIITPKRLRLSGEEAPLAEQMDCDPAPNAQHIEGGKQNVNQEPKLYINKITDKNVLVKIFDYLDLYTLLQVCEVDTSYVQIIGESIMMKRGILNITEISEHYSVRHTLKKFGRFVREVSIKQSDIQWKDEKFSHIEEIVRLIGKRCSSQQLTKLTITFDSKDKMAHKFRQEIPDCLKTLDSLTIIQDGKVSTDKLDKCIKKILNGCAQLKVLTLKNLVCDSLLSTLNSMQLIELYFEGCHCNTISFYGNFLQLGIPSLKTFSKLNCHIQFANEMDLIQQSFPCLEKLSFDLCYGSCSLLGQMANLKSIHLHIPHNYCGTEFQFMFLNILNVLKTMNTLEEFTFSANRSEYFNNIEVWKDAMQGLSSLHSISFHIKSHINWHLIIRVIQEVPNLKSVHLSGKTAFYHFMIEQLIAMSPEMLVIKLDVPISAFTPSLYDKLVQNRFLWHRKSQQLNLYIDRSRLIALKQYRFYVINSRSIALHPIDKSWFRLR